MLVSTTSRTEGYGVAGLRDACAEFVVVGEMVDERFEAADAVEGFAAHGERGAETIAHPAFEHAREQHAGLEIGSDGEGFKARKQRAMRVATVEGSHQAYGMRIAMACRGWLRKRNHHALEVMRSDGDVGIANEQEFVLRVGNELREGADFAIGAEAVGALDEANGAIRKLLLQLLDGCDGGVVERGDAEEEFVGARVILAAVAAKGIEHAGVDALEGLENADAGEEGWERRAARGNENPCRDDGG